MQVQSISLKGIRETNEDEHVVILNSDTNKKNYNKVNIFGVFDGHGGGDVSKFLKANLSKYFLKKNKDYIFENTKKTLRYIENVFDHIQDKLKNTDFANYSGSTALLAIQSEYKNKKHVWVSNVGDSRGVICNKYNIAVQLTKDHKPNIFEERNRIEKLDGKITFDGNDWRIKEYSLSRAFGDLDATPYITHKPQIFKYNLSSKDKFMILACDGLWDVLSNQEVVNFVLEYLNYGKINNISTDKLNIADKLAQFAIKSGSSDNVTVIVTIF